MKAARIASTVAMLLVMALVAGCGGPAPAQPAPAQPAPAQPAPAQPAPAQPAPAQPAPAQPITFNLGVMAIADCIQAFIADAKGYFKEEGLDVKMQFMKGGAEIAPAVAGGSLQAGWSNMVSIALAHERNIDFVFFAPGALETPKTRVHRIMVAANSPAKSLKDLEGKIAATNTLDNIPYVAFAATLQKAGVDTKKVQFVEVPFPNMVAALKEGKVQAAIVPEPFVTAGLTEGSVRVLDEAPFAALGERTFVASWFASDKWIKANPDVVKRFVAALRKANADYVKNPEEGRKILLKYTSLNEAQAAKITIPAFEDQVQLADLQPVIEKSVELGLLKKSFPAQEIIRISP